MEIQLPAIDGHEATRRAAGACGTRTVRLLRRALPGGAALLLLACASGTAVDAFDPAGSRNVGNAVRSAAADGLAAPGELPRAGGVGDHPATVASTLVSSSRGAGSVERPPGPAEQHTRHIELDGIEVAVDVHLPGAGRRDGMAIVAHGFNRSRKRHQELGRALAAAGLVAVVPDLPHVADLWGNGHGLAELVRRLEAGAFGLPPTPRSRMVLIGTSAGGLASVLAAAELPGLAGWIGLDPVDRTGSGVSAAARVTAAAVVLRAPPSACNLYGSGKSIARAVPGLRRDTVFDGVSHCDFEGPTNGFCKVACGGASTEAQARLREVTVAETLSMLGRGG